MKISKTQSERNKNNKYQWLCILLFVSLVGLLYNCYMREGDKGWSELPPTEISPLIYTDGDHLQQVVDAAPPHATIICNRNKQLLISAPITIAKPLTLKGLNARLLDKSVGTSIIEVKSEGVTITDFSLYGNAEAVSQKERAALLTIYAGDFRIERGIVENSSKDGIEVDPRTCTIPIEGGVIRDIVGRGCVRDVISLSGPAGPEAHVRNVLVENIRGYNSPARGAVEISDGCEHITARKIYAEHCLYAVDVQDHNKQEVNRDILVSDVYALHCTHAIRTFNRPNGHSNLSIMNITAEQCKETLYVSNTDGVNIRNVRIVGYGGEGPAISVTNCDVLVIRDITIINCTSRETGLLVENCSEVTIDGIKLLNSDSLSSGVTFSISTDKIYENLFIGNVSAKSVRKAGIILEKKNKDVTLTDYIVSNNIARVEDHIRGRNGFVNNNLFN
ncbi:MAG: hypothetical protein MI975_00015 [Cytophagales bacterium]|nr:hypothetical protein [Cytophagales bacterium]